MVDTFSECDWNKDNVSKLIELFKEHPVLWDAGNPDYKIRNKKHDAWNEIANAMDMDRNDIEKKIRCLIGQYQRNSKKPKSGSGADCGGPKWPYFHLFDFLKDKSKPRGYCEAGVPSDTTLKVSRI